MKILLADNQSRDAKTAAQFLVGLGPPREAEVLLTYVIDDQNWPALPATGRSLQLQQQIDMMRTETSDAARDYLSHAVEQFRDLPLRVDSIVTEGSQELGDELFNGFQFVSHGCNFLSKTSGSPSSIFCWISFVIL